jgi:ethanolaminephosphotransferase
LPWSYDASQIALFFLYVITAIWSHKLWKFLVPVIGISSGRMFELVSHVTSFGLSIPVTFYNVLKARNDRTLKQNSLEDSFRPLIPLAVLFVVTTGWALFSPTDIISHDPRMFFFMVGTVFSNIACRLIVSQMSSTKCEAMNWLLFPLSIFVVAIFKLEYFKVRELLVLRSLTLFFVLAHIHYGVCVVRELAEHFKINVFSLKKVTSESVPNSVGKKT